MSKPLRLALAASLLAGCTMGAPLGFSSGSSWSFPLIAPLEDGPYLVPVKINGKGPYLFLIDPDAPVSSVDAAIRSDLDLYTVRMPEELDERDKRVPVALAEVAKLQVGDRLTVSNLKVHVHKFDTHWSGGRRVRGVLGRDVIADSLIFAADRDRGIATLAVQGKLAPPAGVPPITWRDHRFRSDAPRRRLVGAVLNGTHRVRLHLDPGSRFSMLWQSKMRTFALPTVRVEARMVDEMATARMVDHGAMVAKVALGGAEVNGIVMVPYEDMRTREVDLDGSLGQSFFRHYNLVANWHKTSLWLTPRNPDVVATAGERLARWGGAFNRCANPACVSVTALAAGAPPAAAPPADGTGAVPPVDGTAPLPAAPAQVTLRIQRDPEAPTVDYEVVIEAVDANGRAIGLPRLLATLPKERPSVEASPIDPNYAAAARLVVIDASPFPRECSGATCVWPLSAQ